MALPTEAIQLPAPKEGTDNAKETQRLLRGLLEFCNRFRQQSFDWTPIAIPGQTALEATFTIASDGLPFRDLRIGMPIIVTPPAGLAAGLSLWAEVSATDTVTVRLTNDSSAEITPDAGAWQLWGHVLPGLRR